MDDPLRTFSCLVFHLLAVAIVARLSLMSLSLSLARNDELPVRDYHDEEVCPAYDAGASSLCFLSLTIVGELAVKQL